MSDEQQPQKFNMDGHQNEGGSGEEDGSDSDDKRKGRRKIDISFIENKSRRHITFSKRKAGIMKKAYELATLTGTQVLLLVASETGHVYTFATPKLQPLITNPEGKNLIQACLNAPDANPEPTPKTPASSFAPPQDDRKVPFPPYASPSVAVPASTGYDPRNVRPKQEPLRSMDADPRNMQFQQQQQQQQQQQMMAGMPNHPGMQYAVPQTSYAQHSQFFQRGPQGQQGVSGGQPNSLSPFASQQQGGQMGYPQPQMGNPQMYNAAYGRSQQVPPGYPPVNFSHMQQQRAMVSDQGQQGEGQEEGSEGDE